MNTNNLELKKIEVFGWTSPTAKCWKDLAEKKLKNAWNAEDAKAAEHSLAKNVNKCYQTLMEC
ncbi:MAG: hypothetical protein MJ193_02180 [Clostridia bacterium]|nr:hypothetical protein [Clostridia bacterium]